MVVREDAGCYFNFLVFVKICFVSKYVVSFEESEDTFFCVWMICKYVRSTWFCFCLDDLSSVESMVLRCQTISV